MSTNKFRECGYEIDTTPKMLPDGRFVAHAVATRLIDGKSEDLWPDFDPFATEAEASSAGHTAAVAFVAHQPPSPA
jgi:hypothetical protein